MTYIIRQLKVTLLLSMTLVLAFVSTPSYAFFGDDEARRAIIDLRVQIKSLEEQYQKLTTLSTNNQLKQVSELEQQVRELGIVKTRLELIEKQLQDLENSQKTFYLDIDKRLNALEAGKKVSSVGNANSAWQKIESLLEAENYKEAIPLLELYIKNTPNEMAYQSLLRASVATKNYTNAAKYADTLLMKWPQDPNSAETLLLLAVAQLGLQQQSSAKLTLEKLIKDYPQSPSATIAKKHLSQLN